MSNSKFELLKVDKIKLDRDNPRIARYLEIYSGEITSEQMALALGSGSTEGIEGGPSYNDLKQSKLTNNGIIHPILVNKNLSNEYTVIEGNTRVLIYREFNEQNTEGDWITIPSMVYENLDANKIDAIRLQAHLVGTRNWDPYSKAKYLNHLRNSEHLTFSQIVDFCGGKKREIQTYIEAYNDMEKYYRPLLENDQDFDTTRFSSFIELQSSRVINSLVGSGFSKTDFSQWVIDHKLVPIPNIRQLPKIIKNEESLRIFKKSDSKSALDYLSSLNVHGENNASLQDASLLELSRAISSVINKISWSEIRRLKGSTNNEEFEDILEAKDALITLCKEINVEV
jgi:hypothetical protein